MRLELNQEKTFIISARKFWNDTTLEIQAGEKYKFSGGGYWRDLLVKSDADGYTNDYMKTFDKLKRSKGNMWFALMGSLDKEDSFLIGTKSDVEFSKTGLLSCYANDVKGFYWNNFGHISLTITRVK